MLLAAPAGAQDASPLDASRWFPSLAVVSGITFQQQQADVDSSCLRGGPAGPNDGENGTCRRPPNSTPSFLQPSKDGEDWVVTPYVGANLEILSPVIPGVPGRPRLFLNGEILPSFGPTKDIAKEGNPTGLFVDPQDVAPNARFSEGAIKGAGSQTSGEINLLVWAAAIGAAFPFEWQGRPFLLKPSFGWLQYSVDIDGRVLRGICPPPPGPPAADTTCGTPNAPTWRSVSLSDSTTETYNGIGPGLELEMDVGRWGPFQPSLFLGFNAYAVLGDRKVELSDSLTCGPAAPCTPTTGDPLGTDTYDANWSFEVDPWMFRAGLGLRLRWIGF